jgi:hypothetical protein
MTKVNAHFVELGLNLKINTYQLDANYRESPMKDARRSLQSFRYIFAILALLASASTAKAIPAPVAINVTPDPLGANWEQTVTTVLFLDQFQLEPIGPHQITLFFDDDTVSIFDVSFLPGPTLAGPILFLTGEVYTAQPGTSGALQSNKQPSLFTGGATGPGVVLDDFFNVFDPTRFLFTSEIGETALFDTNLLPRQPPQLPEPNSLGFIAIGLLVLAARRLKKIGVVLRGTL